MRIMYCALVAAALTLGAHTAYAAAPVSAVCKDGSTQEGASRRAACAVHGGVDRKASKEVATPAAATAASTTTAPAAMTDATPTTAAGAAAPARARAAKSTKPVRSTGPIVAQMPTNPGDVWVNTTSKVYHCSGDSSYGKTRKGSFMTETAAKAAGAHASHGKACAV